jgi:hypothetical protein
VVFEIHIRNQNFLDNWWNRPAISHITRQYLSTYQIIITFELNAVRFHSPLDFSSTSIFLAIPHLIYNHITVIHPFPNNYRLDLLLLRTSNCTSTQYSLSPQPFSNSSRTNSTTSHCNPDLITAHIQPSNLSHHISNIHHFSLQHRLLNHYIALFPPQHFHHVQLTTQKWPWESGLDL